MVGQHQRRTRLTPYGRDPVVASRSNAVLNYWERSP